MRKVLSCQGQPSVRAQATARSQQEKPEGRGRGSNPLAERGPSFIQCTSESADIENFYNMNWSYRGNLFKISTEEYAMPRKVVRDVEGRIISFEYHPGLIRRLFGWRKAGYDVDYEQNRIQFHDLEQQRSWDFDLLDVVIQGAEAWGAGFASTLEVAGPVTKYTGIEVVRDSGPYLYNKSGYAPRTTPKNRAMTREYVRTSYAHKKRLLTISWYGRKGSADIALHRVPYPAFGHKTHRFRGTEFPRCPFPSIGEQPSAIPAEEIRRRSQEELHQLRNFHVDGIRDASHAYGRSLLTPLGVSELPFPFEPHTDQTYEGIDQDISANICHIMWRHPFIVSQVFSNFSVENGSVFEVDIEAEHLNCKCRSSCKRCAWDYFTEKIPAKFQMRLTTDDIRKYEADTLPTQGVFSQETIQNNDWVILIYQIQLKDDTWMKLRIPHTLSEGREIHDLLKDYPIEMFEFPQWGVNQSEWRTFVHGSDDVCGHCQRLLEQRGDEGRIGPKFKGDYCPHCKTEFVGFRPQY